MAKGFKVNPQGMRQLQRELEKNLKKYPVRIPVVADPQVPGSIPGGTVVNYNGPVVTVNGDHAQLAWNNGAVTQAQAVEDIAPGYETLAQAVTAVLAALDGLGLNDDDAAEVREQAQGVLAEVTKSEPDQGIVKRGVTMLKGMLAPVVAGVSQAVTAETAETARELIEMLSSVQLT